MLAQGAAGLFGAKPPPTEDAANLLVACDVLLEVRRTVGEVREKCHVAVSEVGVRIQFEN